MAKYDDGFKRKVVEAYQNSEGGYGTLAQRFGISHFSLVRKWVKIVEKRGFEALQRRRTKQHYTSQFKQNVLHYYLNSGDSYLDVALQYGLPSGDLLQS
ncbi:helix-turn-helix domain-containing protein, partial [Listeria ivanovii]